MLKTLLTTSALAALIATGAVAQTPATPAPAPETMAPAAPSTPTTLPTDTVSSNSMLGMGYTIVDSDNLASNVLGMPVYTSAANDAERLGEINDFVVNVDGSIGAVIIGVGGFLGIGEKNVAVSYGELEWVVAQDNTDRLVLATTREALEAAPDFVAEDDDDQAAMTTPMAPADNMAATPAPVPGGAMTSPAPADNMAATTPTTTLPYDRATLTEATLTADDLEGIDAYGPADEHLGGIGDVVLSADGQAVEAVIIDFGGFLGIGTKQVAVSMENLQFRQDASNNRFVFINVTREQLDQAVEFNKDTFAAERTTQLVTTSPMM
jgi:sporulation protein YlmC with PRC-barrel domain